MKAFGQLGPIAGAVAAAGVAAIGAIQFANAVRAKDTALAGADAVLAGLGEGEDPDRRTTFAAEGGLITGPGTGTSDSIPAMLSNGEYVINAASTRQFLPILEQINNSPRRFVDGGLVTGAMDANRDRKLQETLNKIDQKLDKPIKAYVVTSEIQNGIDTQEYLERRAQIT